MIRLSISCSCVDLWRWQADGWQAGALYATERYGTLLHCQRHGSFLSSKFRRRSTGRVDRIVCIRACVWAITESVNWCCRWYGSKALYLFLLLLDYVQNLWYVLFGDACLLLSTVKCTLFLNAFQCSSQRDVLTTSTQFDQTDHLLSQHSNIYACDVESLWPFFNS
jgi:hypothetical protein